MSARMFNVVGLVSALLLCLLVLVPWANVTATASAFGFSQSEAVNISLFQLASEGNDANDPRVRDLFISSFWLAMMVLGPVALFLLAGAAVATNKRGINLAGTILGLVFCLMSFSVVNNLSKERSGFIASMVVKPAFGAYMSVVVSIAYTIFLGLPLGMGGSRNDNERFSAQEFGTRLGQIAHNVATSPQLRQLGRAVRDTAVNVGSGVATSVRAASAAAQGNQPGVNRTAAPRASGRPIDASLPMLPEEPSEVALPELKFAEDIPAADVPFRAIAEAFLRWQQARNDDNARAFSAVMKKHKEQGLVYNPAQLKDDITTGPQTAPLATLGRVLYTHYQLKKIVSIEKIMKVIIPKAMAELS